jgi:hypothetical protein
MRDVLNILDLITTGGASFRPLGGLWVDGAAAL